MTLVLGLRTDGGVVLASDSQKTEGPLRETHPKLFATPLGIVWGSAGSIAIQQELYGLAQDFDLPGNLPRQRTKEAVVTALREATRRATQAIEDPTEAATTAAGLFAWYSKADRHHYLLRALGNGHGEFALRYTAIGGPGQLARFALSRSEHLGYATLPLEAAKMIAFNVADDVIRASSAGVGPPVQMAVVTATGASVVQASDLRGLEDTVATFRELQRDFLGLPDTTHPPKRDTGIRP
jgi:20S proteasome alpha/beta subunit